MDIQLRFHFEGLRSGINFSIIWILLPLKAKTTVAEFIDDSWRLVGDLIEKREGHRAIRRGFKSMIDSDCIRATQNLSIYILYGLEPRLGPQMRVLIVS